MTDSCGSLKLEGNVTFCGVHFHVGRFFANLYASPSKLALRVWDGTSSPLTYSSENADGRRPVIHPSRVRSAQYAGKPLSPGTTIRGNKGHREKWNFVETAGRWCKASSQPHHWTSGSSNNQSVLWHKKIINNCKRSKTCAVRNRHKLIYADAGRHACN